MYKHNYTLPSTTFFCYKREIPFPPTKRFFLLHSPQPSASSGAAARLLSHPAPTRSGIHPPTPPLFEQLAYDPPPPIVLPKKRFSAQNISVSDKSRDAGPCRTISEHYFSTRQEPIHGWQDRCRDGGAADVREPANRVPIDPATFRREDGFERQKNFTKLQDAIFREFGSFEQTLPVLSLRSTTQTSCILEWQRLDIGKDRLLGLFFFKNGQRLPLSLPKTLEAANTHNFVKVTGLEVLVEYSFALEMKTSSGTFWSNAVTVKTHSLDNLTGIVAAFGQFEDSSSTILDSDLDTPETSKTMAKCVEIIDKIGAKWSTTIDINITHFICQIPSGSQYELATAFNIPIVRPEWLYACESDRKLQPALSYYLKR
ncbi:Chitin biosynthesis protein CHS5 [Smittium mucronatum]|uniref:Chitin biosynthesis protein CHS5 n=1 Tax=Smittium mucronatum TaxID=133383 RepID=A0A1R0H3B0_9FUNG|nr:Chitin biosynthesis protein CHS5 [Smittium mucronatum]